MIRILFGMSRYFIKEANRANSKVANNRPIFRIIFYYSIAVGPTFSEPLPFQCGRAYFLQSLELGNWRLLTIKFNETERGYIQGQSRWNAMRLFGQGVLGAIQSMRLRFQITICLLVGTHNNILSADIILRFKSKYYLYDNENKNDLFALREDTTNKQGPSRTIVVCGRMFEMFIKD